MHAEFLKIMEQGKRKADNSQYPMAAKEANEDVMEAPADMRSTYRYRWCIRQPVTPIQKCFSQSIRTTYDDEREKDILAHWWKIKLWFRSVATNRRETHRRRFVSRNSYAALEHSKLEISAKDEQLHSSTGD